MPAAYVRREPRGPIGQVAPWNYPMMMAVWKFAPAPLAGAEAQTAPITAAPSMAK